jgi:PIN domain nuclease of toxin-antitoxin system
MSNILLLDACALIAYFKKEEGFDLLVRIFNSIVLGIASANNYRLLTADHHEFDTIEQNENIAFEWVR